MTYVINEEQSYTEYDVKTPTTDFTVGFDYYENLDNVYVLVDSLPAETMGYRVQRLNKSLFRITPAVTRGSVVRIYRETDIDENKYDYGAGALFTADTMDENFEQIRHSQQELRDAFLYLEERLTLRDTILEIIAGTSFAEPDMTFGVYNTARDFIIKDTYPHVAYSDTQEPFTVGIYRNGTEVATIAFDEGTATFNWLAEITEFKRKDVVTMKLKSYHYTMRSVAVTLIGKFPIYGVR